MTKAFDSVAATYDIDFSNTRIGLAQRRQVWKQLLPLLSKTKNVFEVSCGTGVDAAFMASKVKSIVATDISEAMLLEANKKKEKLQLSNCTFMCLDAANLHLPGEQSFDLLFSNFGGLNCLSPSQLKHFAQQSYSLLNQDAELCLVFIAKRCVWERFYFLFRHTKNRGRRLVHGGTPTTIGEQNFLTHYYSVQELKLIFENYQFVKAAPIGLFVPPGFLEKRTPNFLLRFFNWLDARFFNSESAADYGDHLIIRFRKG